MHTTNINVFPKKGEVQTTRWMVVQETPFPDIAERLQWRNGGGLFPAYGRKAEGIGSRFYCYLLTPAGDVPEDFNRTHFAGYNGNPGTITLRGRSLGEMSVHFDANPQWPGIKVNGFDAPTTAEREFIAAQIIPLLAEFISNNKAALYAEAVEKIKARLAAQVQEARAALSRLEAEAADAVAKL